MKNPFKAFSFQVTFFTSFILISALLIGLLGSTGYYITNQEVVKQTISSRGLLLNEVNKQLALQLQTIEYDSLGIASNPKVISYLQQNEHSFERIAQNSDIIDLLSRLSYVKEAVQSVQLYGKETTENSSIGANGVFGYRIAENSSWYDQIANSDYCWVGTHPIEVGSFPPDDRQVISFARKVLSSGTGKEVGILVVNVKLSFMQNMVAGSSADVARYILDTNHRLIVQAVPKNETAFSFNDNKEHLEKLLDKASSGNFAEARLPDRALLIWNVQDHTQWTVMDIIPWENVTQGSRRIQQVILYATAFCIVLAVVMAYFLSREFVDPIRRLVAAMKQMKLGNLDVQVTNDYQNEFGHLNRNFNQMTTRIEQLITQVNEQNRRKREAELQVLQEQINPHFIYNTLDMMNWHAIQSGARDISRMLALLGKMLRLGLSGGSSFIKVRSEIEHLKCYVELQKIRYKNRIHISVSVPESLYDLYVPKLIIQPFVENALIHGLQSLDEGVIDISAWENESDIYWAVSDNGHGMNSAEGLPAWGHNGIRNVHDRIRLYFGEIYGIHFQSEPGAGTVVTIRMPKILNEPAESRGGQSA